MKKFILSAMLMACCVMASALSVTVHNTSPALCDAGCTYNVRLQTLLFTKPGSFNWGFIDPTYHAVAPGASYTWICTPPAGYTVNWSSLNILTNYCSTGQSYGNASTAKIYNPCSCSLSWYATVWDRNSDGDYNIHCDVLVLRNGEQKETETPVNGEKDGMLNDINEILKNPTLVVPNPSGGMFTLRPGTDLAGQAYTVTVADASGKVVYVKKDVPGDTDLPMDLTALPKGIYLLNIEGGGKKLSHRLVKE